MSCTQNMTNGPTLTRRPALEHVPTNPERSKTDARHPSTTAVAPEPPSDSATMFARDLVAQNPMSLPGSSLLSCGAPVTGLTSSQGWSPDAVHRRRAGVPVGCLGYRSLARREAVMNLTTRTMHAICELARLANCGECWAPPHVPCLRGELGTAAYHVARFARARRKGLISDLDLFAASAEAEVFANSTVVYDEMRSA